MYLVFWIMIRRFPGPHFPGRNGKTAEYSRASIEASSFARLRTGVARIPKYKSVTQLNIGFCHYIGKECAVLFAFHFKSHCFEAIFVIRKGSDRWVGLVTGNITSLFNQIAGALYYGSSSPGLPYSFYSTSAGNGTSKSSFLGLFLY